MDYSDPTEVEPELQKYLDELSPFLLQREWLQLDKNVQGAGGFAYVYRAILRMACQATVAAATSDQTDSTGTPVAVKILRMVAPPGIVARRMRKRVIREIYVWSRLQHDHILEFMGYHVDLQGPDMTAWLVCPFAPKGSIRKYLSTKTEECNMERLSLVAGAAAGLAYLHGLKICHGDVKAENVLVQDDARAVLSDFGLANIREDEEFGKIQTEEVGQLGSLPWCSPELFDEEPRHIPSDTWAFGWLIWEAMTGRFPFEATRRAETIMFRIVSGKMPDLELEPRIAALPKLAELMLRCWKMAPEERPSAEEIAEQISMIRAWVDENHY